MIRVELFSLFRESIVECVQAMEEGLLSVHCRNKWGEYIWNLLILDSFRQDLWDRLWALRPIVSSFWNVKMQWFVIKDNNVQAYFCAAEYLWRDFDAVERYLSKGGMNHVPWIAQELHRRQGLRRAWIAAVVSSG